ncbi:lysine transporter LysE [Pedobacter sp. N36a]|nr:lysine transporter LysE [Pedobacter sp. N36a]MBC8984554.1 lysine transporter LysE [Pedobacter sp. N36a]
MVSTTIVLTASKVSVFFAKKLSWVKVQKWFRASVLTGLALKMAFSKAK